MIRGRQRIDGRLTLITGAARGIGRATAEVFLRAGAPVAVCDLDELAARSTAEALSAIGPEVRAYALDVTELEQFESVAGRIEREMGPIGVLVNNAGIMPLGGFLDQPTAADQKQVEVNLFGVVYGMRAVLPHMLRRRTGHVVNIASVAGRVGTPYAAVYAATKHAVIGLTESVRFEQRDSGVDFSYVMPALVDTELIAGAGRLRFPPPLRPEQVAAAVLRAVRHRKVDVFVPRWTRISHVLPALLPRSVYERIGEAFGMSEMFAHVDEGERDVYVRRVFGADVVERAGG